MINLFIYYSQRKRFIRTLVMHYLKEMCDKSQLSSKSVLGVLQPPRKETDERFLRMLEAQKLSTSSTHGSVLAIEDRNLRHESDARKKNLPLEVEGKEATEQHQGRRRSVDIQRRESFHIFSFGRPCAVLSPFVSRNPPVVWIRVIAHFQCLNPDSREVHIRLF